VGSSIGNAMKSEYLAESKVGVSIGNVQGRKKKKTGIDWK